jgi:hypothetical protein
MTYSLILLTGGIPELIWTFPKLSDCMDEAAALQGACIHVMDLLLFNRGILI